MLTHWVDGAFEDMYHPGGSQSLTVASALEYHYFDLFQLGKAAHGRCSVEEDRFLLLSGSSHFVNGLQLSYTPSYRWINPTYPTFNWGISLFFPS